MVPGAASPNGAAIFHQLASSKGWAYNGSDLQKCNPWQLTSMPENVKVHGPCGLRNFRFDMIKHKSIDPQKPGEWRVEQELQQRLLAQPGHEPEAYTNISNTLEQCISSNAHVVGVTVSYHDLPTHNSYYGKNKPPRRTQVYPGWIDDCELPMGRPTEWNQQPKHGREHPYNHIKSVTDIPDTGIKTHEQIREEKAAPLSEAACQPQSPVTSASDLD